MATLNTVQKSIHLPLTTNTTTTPRLQLMCSASVGNASSNNNSNNNNNNNSNVSLDSLVSQATTLTGGITSSSSLQLRDAGVDVNQTALLSPPTVATTNAFVSGITTPIPAATAATSLSGHVTTTSTLEHALTVGYPDPEMLADVLGTIQTASLRNNNTNNNNNNQSSTTITTTTTTTTTSSNTNSNLNNNNNPNKVTITRRNTTTTTTTNVTSNNNIINGNNINNNVTNGFKDSNGNRINVQTPVSTPTNGTTLNNNNINSGNTNINTNSNNNNNNAKTNTSYIKNCLIRSSSCSNTATNVTTLAQIMSNSSTSSAAAILNNVNSNSNCSSNSNSSSGSNSSCSSLSSNDSALSSLGSSSVISNSSATSNNHITFKNTSNGKSINSTASTNNSTNGNNNATTVSVNHASTNTTTAAAATAAGVKKNRPKLSSPTRHGPQQCQICSKIFGNASALAKHKLTHSDERKYICALCSKAFKRQDHLNGHMMTHRNKKPYECKAEGCGKSYCDARSLRRHTENHHAGLVTTNNSNGNNNQTLSPTASSSSSSLSLTSGGAAGTLSLSPATASGDASSPDGATCIRTYISSGGTVVDAATGLTLTEEQIKAINLPIKAAGTLLSPTTSTSSIASSTSTGSTTNTVSVSAGSPTITLADGATIEGEGLTREHLDWISKIMQQTKQTSAQVTVSSPTSVNSYKINTENMSAQSATLVQTSRPRTWNMQLLNNSQNVSITVDDGTGELLASSSSPANEAKDDELNPPLVTSINPQLLNIVKIDQKPVECNLCHRKFKNIPALNGHMRLHGGYFKKDPETKKNEKKESNGPPLQTASIGVRALIEEKIISKRSKDLNKGAFVVPAPPGSVANHSNTTTIRRSISDLENLMNPKASSASISPTVATSTTTTLLPAATTIKNANGLSIQQIGLPQNIEIFSGRQQQKTVNVGTSQNTLTITTNNIATTASAAMSSLAALSNSHITSTKSTSTADPKDSTLIELLKRGTRIAVTAKKSQPQTSTNLILQSNDTVGGGITTLPITTTAGRQIITNNNRTVIIPSDVQVVSTKAKSMVNNGPTHNTTPASISLADGTPLSLTIAPSNDSSGADVYTVTYTSDTAALFEDAEVYNVSDTEMLLQTVDTMELLNATDDDLIPRIKTEHSDYTLVSGLSDTCNAIPTNLIKVEADSNCLTTIDNRNMTPSTIAGATTTTALPTFQQFHSKEIIMQNSSQIQAITSMRSNTLTLPDLKHQLGALTSPLHSPLAYPTPPSSHENAAQSSPFIDDGQQYTDATNAFFGDKCTTDFANVYFKTDEDDVEDVLTENEKILKLKSVLEESSFDTSIKVEDLLNSTGDGTECDLREFAETNLSFLDEDQEFLNDSGNATSPLSESFFTSGIGTAEEVKEVLREVLPDENIQLSSEQQGENIIDLYYLPGLGLQSQMMPNSEDPLLSSSPREFGQQRPIQLSQMQQQATVEQVTGTVYAQQMMAQLTQPQAQQGQGNILVTTSSTVDGSNSLHYNTVQNLLSIQNETQYVDPTDSNQQNNNNEGILTMQQQQQQQQQINIDGSMLQPLIYTGSATNATGNMNTLTTDNKQDMNMSIQPPMAVNYLPTEYSNTTTNQQQQLQQELQSATFQFNNAGSGISMVKPAPLLMQQTQSQSHLTTAPIATSTVMSTLQPLSNQTNSILKRRLRPNGASDANSHSFSKFHTLSPYRSKLRKPSRTHYTPAPILNPDRKGLGLYCKVRKELAQGMLTFDVFDDDFDDSVGLVDFSDDSKVNLGSTYQAQIPACRGPVENINSIEESVSAELMWDPFVQTDEKILMRYIDLSKSSAVPLGSHSEEVALQTLLKAEGNSAAAVLTLLQTQSSSFQMKWSADELEIFLRGLEKHGKDFGKIAGELITKTTGDCVQMYYFWKKLCVDYKVSHLKAEPLPQALSGSELKPYVCEIPDCSASFSSKAALHGHTRIHTYGRNTNNNNNNLNSTNISNNHNSNNNCNHNSNSNTTTTTNYTSAQTFNNSSNNLTHASSSSSNHNQQHHQQQHQHQNNNNSNNNNNQMNNNNGQQAQKDALAQNQVNQTNSNPIRDGEFPCKVCGKVFNKVKSRSAHMKTHRVQDPEQQLQQQQQQQQQQQNQQQQNQAQSQNQSQVMQSTTSSALASTSSSTNVGTGSTNKTQ